MWTKALYDAHYRPYINLYILLKVRININDFYPRPQIHYDPTLKYFRKSIRFETIRNAEMINV